jgi:hypothetical protein
MMSRDSEYGAEIRSKSSFIDCNLGTHRKAFPPIPLLKATCPSSDKMKVSEIQFDYLKHVSQSLHQLSSCIFLNLRFYFPYIL